jgi:hypothetical protein
MDRWTPFETGSGFLWLASPGHTRSQQVEAGRAYVRQHLLATAAGVDLHPLSQALQEFDAMRAPYAAVHHALGVDPAHGAVQMLVRVGYATTPAGPDATPRAGQRCCAPERCARTRLTRATLTRCPREPAPATPCAWPRHPARNWMTGTCCAPSSRSTSRAR